MCLSVSPLSVGAVKAAQDTGRLGVLHQLSGCLNEVVFICFHKISYRPNLVGAGQGTYEQPPELAGGRVAEA